MDITKLSKEQFEKILSEYGKRHSLSVSDFIIEKGATWAAYHDGIEYFPYEYADGSVGIETEFDATRWLRENS